MLDDYVRIMKNSKEYLIACTSGLFTAVEKSNAQCTGRAEFGYCN